MKLSIPKYFSFSLLLFVAFSAVADEEANVKLPATVEEIAKTIKEADAQALAKYFGTTVEIILPGTDGAYSKAQAQIIFKNYFIKAPPLSFTVKQKGKSAGNSEFFIGAYKTQNKSYGVYVLLKPINGELLIQQIHFEEEK